MSKIPHKNQPMYGWALTRDGKPVPISAAQRGAGYVCPICRGDVVAKLGDIKQHHFAHVNLMQCTPDSVARAVAGIWIADELNRKLIKNEPVNVTWDIEGSEQQHTVNVLKDISAVATNRQTDQGQGDLVLLDRDGKPKVVLLLGIDGAPDSGQVAAWTQAGIAVILLNPVGVRSGKMNLLNLLENSTVLGGWWLLDQAQLPADLVMESEAIRAALRDAVSRPPHSYSGTLQSEGGMAHILHVEGKKLWLPPEIWKEVIGGSHNKLAAGIEVIIQEWAQEDGSHITLFYITMHKANAVAVRRYPPDEPVVIKLDTSAFRLGRTTAIDLAQQLAGRPIQLPK